MQAILGDGFRILEFEESTHSSAEAAAAIGCDVAQIAKSMMFRAADGRPVLVVASGANRVDERKVAALLGQKITRADPVTFLDRDLERYETVWAAGGSPNAVFALTPADLVRLTGAAFGDVTK